MISTTIPGQRACRDLAKVVGVLRILTLLLLPDIQRTNFIRCSGQITIISSNRNSSGCHAAPRLYKLTTTAIMVGGPKSIFTAGWGATSPQSQFSLFTRPKAKVLQYITNATQGNSRNNFDKQMQKNVIMYACSNAPIKSKKL